MSNVRSRYRERDDRHSNPESRRNENRSRSPYDSNSTIPPSPPSDHAGELRISTIRIIQNFPRSRPHTVPDCKEHASLCLITGDRSWVHVNMTQRMPGSITGWLRIQNRDDIVLDAWSTYYDISVEPSLRISDVTSIIFDRKRLSFYFGQDGTGYWLWVVTVIQDLEDSRMLATSSARSVREILEENSISRDQFVQNPPGRFVLI